MLWLARLLLNPMNHWVTVTTSYEYVLKAEHSSVSRRGRERKVNTTYDDNDAAPCNVRSQVCELLQWSCSDDGGNNWTR